MGTGGQKDTPPKKTPPKTTTATKKQKLTTTTKHTTKRFNIIKCALKSWTMQLLQWFIERSELLNRSSDLIKPHH